jgi:hypothetical protein
MLGEDGASGETVPVKACEFFKRFVNLPAVFPGYSETGNPRSHGIFPARKCELPLAIRNVRRYKSFSVIVNSGAPGLTGACG